ncbi:MAG: ribulose-phosphate 3-epimerase [Alistipes sp.]|nr:ribulose-phosphate 3-epimerase [Candidatus Minthomonas equi]
MSHRISPSILGVDFTELGKVLNIINESEADYIHLDVMDGVFVPNISFGFPVIKSISSHIGKPMDAHLMITDPDRYVERCAECGCSMVSVHYEACTHLDRILSHIREYGMKAGIALNPHTPASVLEYSIEKADFVLLMSVNPGFGGQKFISSTYRKIEEVRKMADRLGLKDFPIEIDGGVNSDNAGKLVNAGAGILVAGNAVFNAPNPSEMIRLLKWC